MIGPVSLILVITLSILITRIAAIALVHTGVSQELARFQARSAFTGAGFTTEESERIVNHPVRRRIIMWLMFLGNAGIVTGITTLILTFMDQGGEYSNWLKIGALMFGLLALWLVSSSEAVDQRLSNAVSALLDRHSELNVRDYASLMHLTEEYRLVDMFVDTDSWLEGKTLADTRLFDEGIIVLAIHRDDDTFLGTPQPDTEIRAGDRIVVYGRVDSLQRLDERQRGPSGDESQREGIEEQSEAVEEERREDEDSAS